MMKRTATVTVLGIILVGSIASIAAINAGSSSVVPDLKGRSVILNDRLGFPLGARLSGERAADPVCRDATAGSFDG